MNFVFLANGSGWQAFWNSITENVGDISQLIDRLNNAKRDFDFFFNDVLGYQLLPSIVISFGVAVLSIAILKTILSLGGHSG